MARCITEEQVTKAILHWLEINGWYIISFDFPQSGTCILISPSKDRVNLTNNVKAFIPDIIAYKNQNIVFFENKNRFVLNDLYKVDSLRKTTIYNESIKRILEHYPHDNIFYGIAIPFSVNIEKKVNENLDKIDFAIFFHANSVVDVHFDPQKIFF